MKNNKKINNCLNVIIFLLPGKVLSEEANSTNVIADPMSGSYLFQLVVGLFIVLLCIVALAWFAKRVNRFQSSTGGVLKILGGLSMGAREKVVLMQVGSKQLLVGVSPGRINTLYVLETPIEDTDIADGKNLAGSFSGKLNAMLVDNKK